MTNCTTPSRYGSFHSHCDVCNGCVPEIHGANVICSDACLKALRKHNGERRKAMKAAGVI